MVPAWYLHDTQALILSGLHVHEPGTERAIRCFFMIGRELRAGEAALVALHAGERLGCIDRGRRPVESSCQRSMAAPVVAPPKPWRAEYKKSPELVVCRTCAIPIAGDSFCVINLVLAYKTCLSTEHGIQFLPLDGYVAVILPRPGRRGCLVLNSGSIFIRNLSPMLALPLSFS
jgi:hypothetical protein